jgi:hypothetical protein
MRTSLITLTFLAACGLPSYSEDDSGTSEDTSRPLAASESGSGADTTMGGATSLPPVGCPDPEPADPSTTTDATTSEGSSEDGTTGDGIPDICGFVEDVCRVDDNTKNCGCLMANGVYVPNVDPEACGCEFAPLGDGMQCWCSIGCGGPIIGEGECSPQPDEACTPTP